MLKSFFIFFTKKISDSTYLKIRYLLQFGKILNLKSPKTFNEKIQWLKINNRTDLHTQCADKFLVRKYVKNVIGEEYLIPLVFNTKNVNDVQPKILPNYPVIIKLNHDSGSYFIIRDKKNQNWDNIRSKLLKSLNRDYYILGREWQYKNIKRIIIVEKLLIDNSGKTPKDFKFHCFNGEVKFIQVDIDRENNHKRNMYDLEWNLLDFEFNYKKGIQVKKPLKLNELIILAKKLSSKFIFARVDFYEVNGNIYFGEITFHPESGFGKFYPKSKDLEYGQILKLPAL